MPNPDPIRHVVLLMLENRSFDQMLGCFGGDPRGVDGIDAAHPRVNFDSAGKAYPQQELNVLQNKLDPIHAFDAVAEQLEDGNGGFIKNFIRNYPKSTDERAQIMGYYGMGKLPALHALAKDFTICDRWFSSLPGPTWPNRFFALTGTSSGQTEMPETSLQNLNPLWYFHQRQTTIFDMLNRSARRWKVYYYDFPCSWLLMRQVTSQGNRANYHRMDEFFRDVHNEPAFPDFVFIEPKYFGQDQNDDHPPHNVMKSEKLIADVYNAIRSNEALWHNTLLIITFDEHGGFYDHVPPPAAEPPDGGNSDKFTRLGVRVPALLVSPWVGKSVIHTQFDHTSVLKYLIEKWSLGPASTLGNRTAAAASFAAAITASMRAETDTIPFIRVPYTDLIPGDQEIEKDDTNVHQRSIQGFSHLLALRTNYPQFINAHLPAGLWARVKKQIGIQAIRFGNSLAGDFELHKKQQIANMTEMVERLKTQDVAVSLPEAESRPANR